MARLFSALVIVVFALALGACAQTVTCYRRDIQQVQEFEGSCPEGTEYAAGGRVNAYQPLPETESNACYGAHGETPTGSLNCMGGSGAGARGGSGGPVYVHGYTRANGTYVAPYTRRR